MTEDNRRQIAEAGGMAEVVPPTSRQVTDIAGTAELVPGQYRQITDVAGTAEFVPGQYRQITDVALVAELIPCIEQPGDHGYEEKQFYLDKLRHLKEHHGSRADLAPYEGCISVAQLEALKRLYVAELLATDVMAPIAFLLRPLFGL